MEVIESTELSVVAHDSGLEPTKVEGLLANFGSAYANAKVLASGATDLVVSDESQADLMQDARRRRLALKAVRVEVENTRKSLKEQSLREGKAIDGMANIIKALIVPVEEHLEKQEKFAEVRQAERKAVKKAERVEQLSQFVDDPGLFNLEDLNDEAFNHLLSSSRQAHEAQIAGRAKAEAARLEAERATFAEQERIRAENIKLKEEAAARQAEIEEERRKRAEIEKAEAARIAEQEAKEREAAEAERKALHASDREKLNRFADEIESIVPPIVSAASTALVVQEAMNSLQSLAKSVRADAEEL